MGQVRVRRVYEEPAPSDGRRVLVDRLWPRGLAKEAALIDEWLKAVAPSDTLRRWYGHEPARFAEFSRCYGDELAEPERAGALRHLQDLASAGTVTLLTAARDIQHSQAAELARRLRHEPATESGSSQNRGSTDHDDRGDSGHNRSDSGHDDRGNTGHDRGDSGHDDRGGDPACWLHLVCARCGTIADTDPPTTCPQCGAPVPSS
ncbi:MAG: DUF488 domain-containing protein [Streptosporangiaceae bacterium]